MENTKPFFLILGMHRSGTSCLTGALERCGIYLGSVRGKGKYNKKGYFEIVEIQKIQDQILALNKCSWSDPPKEIVKVQDFHKEQLCEIIQGLKLQSPCGLKDPRCLLLLDFWKTIIGDNLQPIGTFRHPMAVAQSLYTRNQIPIEKGLELWVFYNKVLVEAHQKKPFPLIHFDLSNPKAYKSNILKIAKYFDLKPNPWKLHFFISKKLEHHHFSMQDIPLQCLQLYDYLKQHSNE
jgi:hypothetical protein